MKTTVDIPLALLQEAKKVAAAEGSTVRALMEEGLRRVLLEHQQPSSFHLRKVSFKGDGLYPDLAGGSWDSLRHRIYEGRGG